MIEAKNVTNLTNANIAQTATYMGERIGHFALIVTRNPPDKAQILKAYSVYNDSGGAKRKVILIVSDVDIQKMAIAKSNGQHPTKVLQSMYREFKLKCQ